MPGSSREANHTPQQAAEARDTDPLHELLQDHIKHCDQCRTALDQGATRGFGKPGFYCETYYGLVTAWSAGEYTREEDKKLG